MFALDPETGKAIGHYERPRRRQPARRGVLAWRRGERARAFLRRRRDSMLALDARTGALVHDVWQGGLRRPEGERARRRGRSVQADSPPAIYKDIVITGGNNGEAEPEHSGCMATSAGWDARSGKLLWSFHTVPRPGEPGVETWERRELAEIAPAPTRGRS